MLDSDLSPFECVFNLALVNGADCDDEVARSELKGTGVQGWQLGLAEEIPDQSQVVRGHWRWEVACDAAILRETQRLVGLFQCKHLDIYQWEQSIYVFLVHLTRLSVTGVERVREDNGFEGLWWQLGDEFGVPKGMIIAHVWVESTDICDKSLPFFLADSFFDCGILQKLEVFTLEIQLKEDKECWWLIWNLVENHLCPCPTCLIEEVSVVLFLFRQQPPRFVEL